MLREQYGLTGELVLLDGEVDLNYRLSSSDRTYLLKVSRPDMDEDHLDFQSRLLAFLESTSGVLQTPRIIYNKQGQPVGSFQDGNGQKRNVRLLTWVPGKIWSTVSPHSPLLLAELGVHAGKLTTALSDFEHPQAHREFEWDIAQSNWVETGFDHFDAPKRKILQYFLEHFRAAEPVFQTLRKQVVHNDVNDNNIVLERVDGRPTVSGIIDFGDAIHTQLINDLAITIAYAISGKPDVWQAAHAVVRGYHSACPLQRAELMILYPLVAMRLVISVCKSKLNSEREPDNHYLQVSDASAWQSLQQWYEQDEAFLRLTFYDACGMSLVEKTQTLTDLQPLIKPVLTDFIATQKVDKVEILDLGLESNHITPEVLAGDHGALKQKIQRLLIDAPKTLFISQHHEIRPLHYRDSNMRETGSGPEYRNILQGIDVWLNPGVVVNAPFDCRIHSIRNASTENLVLLEFEWSSHAVAFLLLNGLDFDLLELGAEIKKGARLGLAATPATDEILGSTLHIQLLIDPLSELIDIPSHITPSERGMWSQLSVDPMLLFREENSPSASIGSADNIFESRRRHLGRSLSLSYDHPLHMVRGMGAYLIDATGRPFLDTVNNVAHVGHEHPRIVKAGQRQMALLNTNTRYLHDNITAFAEALLATLPPELSVIYFVNSGSEANELALRMAYTWSGEKDMLAVERGYHGNTNACIDISSYKFDSKGGQGCPEHTHIVPLPDAFRGLYRGAGSGPKYATHLEQQIELTQGMGRGVAGFICESIVSCGGQIELPEGYLKAAFESVRAAGGLCISDEVQVGCGRVGSHFWGFQLHDTVPDIVTIGKPIGNGHPLAAVVCTAAVAEAFANGMEYFNTFGGNPVSCAMGHEVLKVIQDEDLQRHALSVGTHLKKELVELQKEFPIIGDVRGQGLFLGFELTGPRSEPLSEQATYLTNRMRDFGILMSTDGKDNNVLKIKPPLVFSRANAVEFLERLRSVFSETMMENV